MNTWLHQVFVATAASRWKTLTGASTVWRRWLLGLPSRAVQLATCSLVVLTLFLISSLANSVGAQDQRNAVQMWVLQGQTEEAFMLRIKSQGDRALGEIKGMVATTDHPLTAEQDAKLKLALAGIHSRFLQDLAQLRAQTDGFDLTVAAEQQKALELLQPAMQQVQQGWYGKEFFEQVVQSTLDTDQKKLLADRKLEKRLKRHRALTLRAVADLDTRLGLTTAQREKLVELMNKHDIAKLPENYESIVGFMKLLKVPPKDLEDVLDASQRESLAKTLEPYQNYERMFP